MKKLWFPVLMFLTAAMLSALMVALIFIDDEMFIMTAAACSYVTAILFIITIGMANLPRRN